MIIKLCLFPNYVKIRDMNNKVKTVIKDGLVGMGIGCAIIVPGISGGTIALITGAFKKIVNAVDQLLTKYFLKNLLILLPFGIGAILAIAGLYFPIKLSFEHCFLAITCLFAGFMIGSVPSVGDNIKGKKLTASNYIGMVIGFLVVIGFGVLSILYNLDKQVQDMFTNNEFYLYPTIFAVGVISSMGLIVPGFSGSMLLMVMGFYDKILGLISDMKTAPGLSILRLFIFAVGVAVGFIVFSKLMKWLFDKHETTANCIVIGFLVGSIIAIFVNSNAFKYYGYYSGTTSINILDYILSPIFLIVGLVISILIYFYMKKHPEQKEDA